MLTRWMSVDLWTGRSQFRTLGPGPLTRVFYKNWSDHAGLDEDLVVFQMILSLGGNIKPLALSDFFITIITTFGMITNLYRRYKVECLLQVVIVLIAVFLFFIFVFFPFLPHSSLST